MAEQDTPAFPLLPGMPGSYEALLHQVGIERFLLPLRDAGAAREAMLQRRLARAIGVIYLPRSERRSHYFSAQMARQFDAVIHIDRTTAVQPLDPGGGWHAEEPPKTYRGGL